MLYFPQLLSGALTQFPSSRKVVRRTVATAQRDGRMWRLADDGAARLEWRLEYRGISEEERAAIEQLFDEVEGRLGSFRLLDPLGNLLAWSEDLSAGVWSRDPMLELTPEVRDPEGSNRATRVRNPGPIGQRIEQAVEAPGWFQYCFSVYVRSEAGTEVKLIQRTATSEAVRSCVARENWRRLEHSAKLANSDDVVFFGLEVPAGGIVEVYGFQAEPQVGASKYKKTLGRSGVYEGVHFLDDTFSVSADGPGQYSCVVRLEARG